MFKQDYIQYPFYFGNISRYGFRFEEKGGAWGPEGSSIQNGYTTSLSPFYFAGSGFVRVVNDTTDYFGHIGWQWTSLVVDMGWVYDSGFGTKTTWIAGVDGAGSFGLSLCIILEIG